MPPLETRIHLDMLARSQGPGLRRRLQLARRALLPEEGDALEAEGLARRTRAALGALFGSRRLYGLEWGDPDEVAYLRHVRDHFLKPYVTPATVVLEVGPGGGRWTRYMLGARHLYLVDYHQELLDELARSFRGDTLTMIRNGGSDFPGVPPASVDFLFSFGCFVHLDSEIIDDYLRNMAGVLKPRAIVVLQYSDKTKELARRIPGFADNDPERMRQRIEARGFTVYEEDTTSLPHSAVVRFGPAPADPAAK